jgi:hypothetical protein
MLACDRPQPVQSLPDGRLIEALGREQGPQGRIALQRTRPQAVEAPEIRLLGAVLLEQNDEWSVQTRYMQVEAMAELAATDTADPIQIPPLAA